MEFPALSVVLLLILIAIYVHFRQKAAAADSISLKAFVSAYPEALDAARTMKKKLKLISIVNPIGGAGKGKVIGKLLDEVCKLLGHDLTLIETQHRGHAEEIVSTTFTNNSSFDCCICVSGDGMLNEILNTLLKNKHTSSESQLSTEYDENTHDSITPSQKSFRKITIPLMILPTGTGNGVATSLGVNDILKSLSTLISYKRTAVDLTQLRVGRDFLTHSILSTSWGFIADSDAMCEGSLRWMGTIRLLLAPLYYIIRNKAYDGRLEFVMAESESQQEFTLPHKTRIENGKTWTEIDGQFSVATAINLPWLASDIYLAPDCGLADGDMTLLFLPSVSRFKLLKMFAQAESGSHVNSPIGNIVKVTEVRIIPTGNDDGNIVYDGETAPYGPLHLRSLPQAVTFLTPS